MRRYTNWLIGALTIATTLAHYLPSYAQNQNPCCSYRVIHQFRVCLPQGCQPQVFWKWNTQAAAWQIGQTPVINTNNGMAQYPVPSNDTQCASASVGQQPCAVASACASFSVNWLPGTNCVQGQHTTFGRACAFCRRHGANSHAQSYIMIACPQINNAGTILWAPHFEDVVGGECGVQITDPVYVVYRQSDGSVRPEMLFDLRASGLSWISEDTNNDGLPEAARIIRDDRDRPRKGHVTLLRRNAGPGNNEESRLHIRHEDGIVVEAEASGEFAGLRLPNVGDPMPETIEVPAVFALRYEPIDDYTIESLEMGGGGDSGQPVPVEGDLDGNGCVDDADLLIVLFNFGNQGGSGDANNDGIVDDADLLIVLFNFGAGC